MEKKTNKHGHDAVGQEDSDIDNDGDTDKSDSYLHNRRKAIKASMKKEEASYRTLEANRKKIGDGDTRMGTMGTLSDAERAERAKKYREKNTMKKENYEQVDEKLSDEAKSAIRFAAGGRGTKVKVKPLVKLAQMAKKPVREEAIDELSEPTVRNYYNKAGEQGKKIADKMKIGGGDWTADGSDTKTLRKRAAGRDMALKRRRGEIKMSEGSGLDLARTVLNNIRNEIAEGIDEAAFDAQSKAHDAHFKRQPQAIQTRLNAHLRNGLSYPEAVAKVKKTIDRRNAPSAGTPYVRIQPMKEDVESIDEALGLDAEERYRQHHVEIKNLLKSIDRHVRAHKENALYPKDYHPGYQQDIRPGRINWGHVGELAHVHSQLADIHDRLAQQGEYKKSTSESVDEDVDQIDELSKKTLGSYIKKAGGISGNSVARHMHRAGAALDTSSQSWAQALAAGKKSFNKGMNRARGVEMAADRMMKEAPTDGVASGAMDNDGHLCATKVFHKEWAEGTPIFSQHAEPDANGNIAWYDVMFEHGIEKGVWTEDLEILMAESHMRHSKKRKMKEEHELDEARGRPRKNPLPAGKNADPDEVEARMHIIQQLERAKLSMRGGEPVSFMDGTKHTVHSPDANKIIMKYHSMKPFEKEIFQKKIHASHAGLKAEL